MKGVLLLICAAVAHINAQAQCGCGCSSPRPLPLCPRPPPPPRPIPCPRPTPCRPPCPPCPPPVPSCPPPPACPRPLPPCPRPKPVCLPAPVVEICDYNQAVPFIQAPLLQPPVQQPLVTYEASPYSPVGLPSCNCPAPPSLPVSQLYPNFTPILPYVNSGLNISPCLGGVADFYPLSPVGLINPFLPAASPISALAPTVSSLYPPINPCGCGCQYLKKIPIPPPCI